jgi:hypothetical protein
MSGEMAEVLEQAGQYRGLRPPARTVHYQHGRLIGGLTVFAQRSSRDRQASKKR